MNRRDNVRLQLVAATLAACVIAACTPFDTAKPDGGDGAGGDAAISSGAGAGGSAGPSASGLAGATAGAPGTTSATGGVTGTAGTDGGADAPADMATETGGGTDLKATGAMCSRASECATNACVDGVCCATACAQTCMACANAKTGAADGKCAPVKAGLPHANDCAASDPTTCGLDGKCDGTGTCSHYDVTTTCGPEACSDGPMMSTYAPTRRCDGKGSCQSSVTNDCGGVFRCGGTKCNANCSGPQQCTAGAYCSATTCVPKKDEGALCLTGAECVNGSCAGRCCLGCKCTQPSSANLLINPGFDKNVDGWSANAFGNPLTGVLSWSELADVEDCPYSGGLVVSLPTGTASAEVRLCARNVSVEGKFTFGVRELVPANGNSVCGVRFYSSSDCSGDEIVDAELNFASGGEWQAPSPESAGPVSVQGGHSVLFFCDLSSAGDYAFDQPYVSKIPSAY